MKKFILGLLLALFFSFSLNAQTYRPIRGRLNAPTIFNFIQKANTDTVLANRDLGIKPNPRNIEQSEDKDEDSLVKNRPRPIDRIRSKRVPIPTNPALRTVLTNVVSPSPNFTFDGSMDANYLTPPDIRMAVGRNHIIQTNNQEVNIYSKTGVLISRMSTFTFFNPSGTTYRHFDPHIVYDNSQDRWVSCIAGFLSSNNHGAIIIAISATSDPTGSWYHYVFDAAIYNTTLNDFVDYPLLGYNKNWIVITANIFSASTVYGATYVLNKNLLYNGQSSTVNTFITPDGFGTAPAETKDPNQNIEYLVDSWNPNYNGYGYIRLRKIDGTVNFPILSVISQIGIPQTWASPIGAIQSGGNQTLEIVDDRVGNLVYTNNSLWFAHTVCLPTSNPDHSAIQWWQIDPNTVGVQQIGRIEETDTLNSFFFFPSIAVDQSGNFIISHGKSSPNMYASACYSVHVSSDPLNYTRTYYPYKSGLAYYVKTMGSGRNRWGDYFGSAIDPVDNSFWVTGEWADYNDMWATSIANVPSINSQSIFPCSEARVLTSSVINDSTVVLNWDTSSLAFQYNVYYRVVNNVNSFWRIAGSTSSSSFTISNLSPGTTYEWRISSVCTGNTSFSNIFSFSTGGIQNCPTIAAVVISDILFTTSKVKLELTLPYPDIITNYIFRYKPYNAVQLGDTSWTYVNIDYTKKINLSGLTPGTKYYYQVISNCTNSSSLLWKGNGQISYSPNILNPYSTFTTLDTNTCKHFPSTQSLNIFAAPYPDGRSYADNRYIYSVGNNINAKTTIKVREVGDIWRVSSDVDSSNWRSIQFIPLNYDGMFNNMSTTYQFKQVCLCHDNKILFESQIISKDLNDLTNTNNSTFPKIDGNGVIAPQTISEDSVTNKSVKLTWVSGSLDYSKYPIYSINAAIGYYRIRYRDIESNEWIYDSTTTNSLFFRLNNLSSSTTYEWQVQTVTYPQNYQANFSPFTPSNTFTTLPSSCAAPLLFAGRTTDSLVTLNWSNTGADLYNIRYRIYDSNNDTTRWINVSTSLTSINLTNLETGNYVWQVQSKCNDTLSPFNSSSFTITSSTFPITYSSSISNNSITFTLTNLPLNATCFYYIKQVTDVPLPDSVIITNNSVFTFNNLLSFETYLISLKIVYPNGKSNYIFSDQWFTMFPILNPIFSSNITTSSVTLNWRNIPEASFYNIQYKNTNSINWTTNLISLTNSINITNLSSNTNYDWRVQAVSSKGIASGWSQDVFITVPCNGISSISVTSVTTSSISISWPSVSFATGYNIKYYPASSPSNIIYVSSISNSYTISNLLPGTAYYIFIQNDCGSVWYTLYQNTYACNNPLSLSASNVTSSSATLNWGAVSGVSFYNIRYRILGTTTWNTVNSITRPYTLSNLTPGTSYQWQVQSNCGNSVSSWSFSSPLSFTTSTSCNTPTLLSTSNITSLNATLNWDAISGATGYNIRYRVQGTSTWTTITTSATSTSLSNLTSGTTYEWQVQSNCGSGNLSSWSNIITFNTLQCNTPTSLTTTNITSSSATLSWGSVSIATGGYNIQYRVQGTSTWTNINTLNTSVSLSNLSSGTLYEWQVRSNCGTGIVSSWSNITMFTTLTSCNAPLSFSFSNLTTSSVSLNWGTVSGAIGYNIRYRVQGTSTWTTDTSSTNSYTILNLSSGTTYEWQVQTNCGGGILSIWSNSSTFTVNTCVTPTSLSTSNISYSSATLNWNTISGNVGYNIRYRIQGTSTWTTDTSSTNSYNLLNLTPGIIYEWQIQTKCSGGNLSGWSIFSSFTTLQCNTPTSLSTSNISYSSATLNWGVVSGSNIYNVRYRVQGTSTWTTDTSSTNSYTLSNLTPGESYEWQIQSDCNNGVILSVWSTLISFNTLQCNIPTSLTTTNITSSSATLSWDIISGSTRYNIRYQISGTNNWNIIISSTNSYNLLNLIPNSTYEWQVQTDCGNGILSGWSTLSTFTTLIQCNTPTFLATSNIYSTNATLNWNPILGSTSYNIRYKISGTSTWTNITSQTNYVNITNLIFGVYEWQVQSNCGNGNLSSWSNITMFTLCDIPTSIFTSNITPSSAILNWDIISGVAGYNIQYRIQGTNVWINAVSSTNSYTLSNLTPDTTYEWQVQTDCGGSLSLWSTLSTFTTLIQCNIPTSLTTTDIYPSSATLNWGTVLGGLGYNIRYRVQGTSTWTNINNIYTNFYTFSNLSSNTTYEWQVQTNCGNGNLSSWSNSTIFNTLTQCDVPNTFSTTNITSLEATLNWNPILGVVSYNIRYKISGTNVWNSDTSLTNNINISNLVPNTVYEWQVQTNCGNGNISLWSNNTTFTTLTQCNIPNVLSITNITSSSATLNWGVVSGATGYNIRYRVQGASTWITDTSLTNFYNISNISSGTTYEWQVQTNCSNYSSLWSNIFTFITLTQCNTPTSLSTSNISYSSATLNWGTVSGTNGYNIQYRETGSNVWITNTSQTNYSNITNLFPNTIYEWQVQTDCSGGLSSWSNIATFNTLQCNTPTLLSTSNVTSSSAILNWENILGATGYNVRYRIIGSNLWTTDTSSINSIIINNLIPDTTYEWQVQTDCSGGLSSWSNNAIFRFNTCNTPTSLSTSNITYSGASLSWNIISGVINYNIQYRVQGTTNWITDTSSTNSYTLSNLTPGESYEWQVQSDCDSGNLSLWSRIFTFTTLQCNTPTLLSTSNVTYSDATLNWSSIFGVLVYNVRYRVQGTTNWITDTSSTNSYTLSNLTSDTTYEWQVQTDCNGGLSSWSTFSSFTTLQCSTPTSLSTSNISYSSATLNWNTVSGSVGYNVRYRIQGANTWTNTISSTNLIILSNLSPNTIYEWQIQTNCGSGNVSSWSTISSFTTLQCITPTSLSTSNVTSLSAILNWGVVSGVTGYNIQYREIGSNIWITDTSSTTSITLSNLISNTAYEWRIQSNCGGGVTSSWSNSLTFTTLIQCNTPTSLSTSNITSLNATLNWGSVLGINSYNIRYRIQGTNIWTTNASSTTSITLSNLSPNTIYEWQVQSDCGNGNTSAFSTISLFITLVQCNAPTSLNVLTSAYSAAINWNTVSGSTSYNLRYRIVGTTTWNYYSTLLSNNTSLLNLIPNTNYEWQVQSDCGGGNLSSWSVSSTFITITPCNAPTSLTTTNIATSSVTLNWGTVNGAISYNVQYRTVGTTTWNIISSGFNFVNISNLFSNTNYEWQVQSICSNGSSTIFSSISTFTTSIACTTPPVSSLQSTITCCNAVLTWQAITGASAYKIYYRKSSTTTWSTITTTTSSNTYTLSGLSSSTTYYWLIQTICPGGVVSTISYTNYATLITTASCGTSGTTSTTNITRTSAQLNWSKVTKAVNYTIRWRIVGTNTWSTLTLTNLNYVISSLTPNTNYEWQVQTQCSTTISGVFGYSLWSTLRTFRTLP